MSLEDLSFIDTERTVRVKNVSSRFISFNEPNQSCQIMFRSCLFGFGCRLVFWCHPVSLEKQQKRPEWDFYFQLKQKRHHCSKRLGQKKK